jgi:thymidine phosphorylase
MLVLTRVQPGLEAARTKTRGAIASGAGLDLFRRVIEAQGGDPRVCDDPSRLPHASGRHEIRAKDAGFLHRVGCRAAGEASMLLGAGRNKVTDNVDPAVGIELSRKVGDAVARGDVLATLHFNDQARLAAALARLDGAFEIGSEPAPARPLVRRVIE